MVVSMGWLWELLVSVVWLVCSSGLDGLAVGPNWRAASQPVSTPTMKVQTAMARSMSGVCLEAWVHSNQNGYSASASANAINNTIDNYSAGNNNADNIISNETINEPNNTNIDN